MTSQRSLIRRASLVGVAAGACLFATVYPALAATAPSLGSAQSFAVLAGTTVTNTGPTTITGDLGVSPGSAITGQASITLTGAIHAADSVALQAQNDVTAAYNALAAATCTQSFTGAAVELGGRTLGPGVYCFDSSAQLTGTLTLNGGGVFIFKIASTLTTAVNSTVALIGGASPCNVFWQIGSSAALFANTGFVGSLLALTSITLQTGASVSGQVLARNGAVTMDTNTITTGGSCAAAPAPTPAATPTPTPTPTPTSTPQATPTATPTATPQATPTATPHATPTATPPIFLPGTDTAGAPLQRGTAPWLFVLITLSLGLAAWSVRAGAVGSRPH